MIVLVLLSVSVHAAEAVDPEVLVVREAAWRAWFGGDEAALRGMLPEEFLAISAGEAEISDRENVECGNGELPLSFERRVCCRKESGDSPSPHSTDQRDLNLAVR